MSVSGRIVVAAIATFGKNAMLASFHSFREPACLQKESSQEARIKHHAPSSRIVTTVTLSVDGDHEAMTAPGVTSSHDRNRPDSAAARLNA